MESWARIPSYSRIVELCEACKDKIFDELPLFRRIYPVGNNATEQTFSEPEELALRALLRSTAGTFIVLHELLLFLPRESIRSELRDYCECLFRPVYDSKSVSLILTSLFNAFEYSLDDIMRFLEADVFKFKIPDPKALSFGNVMELAIVDRNNPLAWAVLAHEFGHFLDDQSEITKVAVSEFVRSETDTKLSEESVKALERLCKEIVADVSGYYLQGPCSVLPLVNMSVLVGCIQEMPVKFDGEHGAPTTRIQMMRTLCEHDKIDLSSIDPHLQTLLQEETQKESALANGERQQRTLIHQFLLQFFDKVRPIILDELGKRKFNQFTADHYRRAEASAQRLAGGLPIGASGTHGSEEAREHLVRADLGAAAREKYYLLQDKAASVSEVITAGWINRIASSAVLFSEAFAQTEREEIFSRLANGLEDQDKLLFKSIDMIPLLEAHRASAG